MALIYCPECKKQVSDSATSCPNCGYSIEKYMNSEMERMRIHNEQQKAAISFAQKQEQEKQELIKKVRSNPSLLDKTMNGKVGDRPSLYRIYEFHNGKLWVSLCTGFYDDTHGRIDEGYYCRKCVEAYIDENGVIRTVGTNEAHGQLGTFSIDKKIQKDKTLSSHPYPCYRESSSGGGCYIATCIYGSYDCPEVWTLRRFRDNVLNEVWYGRLFIKCYYKISPVLVRLLGETKVFRSFWKNILDRMVCKLNNTGIEATKYNDKY